MLLHILYVMKQQKTHLGPTKHTSDKCCTVHCTVCTLYSVYLLTPRSATAKEARKKLHGRWRDLLVAMATRTSVFPTKVSRISPLNTHPEIIS